MPLPDASVHMCVTSPPYWGLRDYGLETGIGLEPTLGEWVQNTVAVMREVRRVLRDDGTCWLNLGDAYDSGTNAKRKPSKDVDVGGWQQAGQMGDERVNAGLGAKQLMGQPWRVAFALQDDGWLLRSAIVWHKPNPMPESVRDRPTNAYEMLFLLAKSGKYYYDAEAIREGEQRHKKHGFSMRGRLTDPSTEIAAEYIGEESHTVGANARNVWTIPTQGRPDAHFAAYPDSLPRRCILAGTSERGVCADCGAPWVRVTETVNGRGGSWHDHIDDEKRGQRGAAMPKGYHKDTLGWQPTCGCNADTVPATVLDPFAGSGTTLAVAQALGRQSVGLDLNPEYLEIAKRYINRADGITLPMVLS